MTPIGLVVGAVAGLAVYEAIRLSGWLLFPLVGSTAGLIAAVLYTVFRRSARLTMVKISVPRFTELSFAVTEDRRRTAWNLFVESVTRTSTQPLTSGTGSLREALTSLHGLFAVVRETLKTDLPDTTVTPGPTVEYLAVALLNEVLRPFLARWHPELRQWERQHPDGVEGQWPFNAECRADLTKTQARVVQYARGFAELAGFDRQRADALLHAGIAEARMQS